MPPPNLTPTFVQQVPIPVQNKSDPNDPKSWYFDGKRVRSDTTGTLNITLVGNVGTSPLVLALQSGLGIQYATPRFIIGVTLSASLECTSGDQVAIAVCALARHTGAELAFQVIPGTADGATPGVLISARLNTFNPLGSGRAISSKNVGMGFGHSPFFVAANDILNWYLYKNSTSHLDNFYAHATIFSVPAE